MKSIHMPENFMLYGFVFGDFNQIDINKLYFILEKRDVDLKDVTFSLFDDPKYNHSWLIAGTRYVNENEINQVFDYLIYNELEEEFNLFKY